MTVTTTLAAALADRYAIEREVGRGGMATVYLARDVKHERLVALKVLDPELGAVLGAERFLAEIRVTANLQHPNLLPLFDSGEAGGLLYYVMPFVEGESLRARLDREKQLPIDEAVRIATGVAQALAYAHGHGVIHRDLKPENILLQHGQPVVADFGIALAVSNAGGTRITQTGLSLGTPQYMSPEQALGEKTVDARSDIYALGAVCYEMLTGDPPFTGSTVQAIVAKVLTERPPSPRAVRDTVPAAVERAVLKALAKLPADRPSSAQAFAEALSGARPVTDDDVAAATGARPAATTPSVRALRAWQLAAAVLAVAAAGLGTLALRRPRAERPPLQRFDLVLPDSVRLYVGAGRKVAMTRDGSRTVFVGMRGGTPALYVRGRGDPAARLVPGTAGILPSVSGFSPALSPDGEWLAFNNGDRIVRLPVNGGSGTVVADSAVTPAWTDRNAILYIHANGLWLLPGAGMPARRVAGPDTARGWRELAWPEALPGGTHALITIDHSIGNRLVDSLTLGVVDLASGRITDTGVRGTDPRALADGWVLFGQAGGRVAAAPFSLAKRAFTRAPTVLLEGVWQGTGGATGFAVADDGVLVYIDAREAETGVTNRLAAFSPTGEHRILPPTSLYLGMPRVSPDGRRLLLADGQGINNGVSVVDLATGAREQLVARGEGSRGEWMRDGRRVAFLRQSGERFELVSRAVDRSAPDVVLTRTTLPLVSVSLGPPGGWAVFRGQAPGQTSPDQLLAAPMDSLNALRPLATTRGRECHPAVSPDGRLVAWASDESGAWEVYAQPLPGPGPRLRVSPSGGTEPVWGGDGRTLFFRAPAGVTRATLDASRTRVVRLDILFADTFDRTSLGQRYWDLAPSGELVFTILPAASGRVQAIARWQALLKREAPE